MNPNAATATPMVPRMMNDIVPPYASAIPKAAPQPVSAPTPAPADADQGQLVGNIPVQAPMTDTPAPNVPPVPPQPGTPPASPFPAAPSPQPETPQPVPQPQMPPQQQPMASAAHHLPKLRTQWLVIGLAVVVALGLAAAAYYSLKQS